jgi:hypothetical protein
LPLAGRCTSKSTGTAREKPQGEPVQACYTITIAVASESTVCFPDWKTCESESKALAKEHVNDKWLITRCYWKGTASHPLRE